MSTEIISSLNWIDILLALVLIRAVYIGIKIGFVVEFFKLAGVLFAVFITLHYFSGMSQYLQDKVHLPKGAADVFSFGFLWGLMILAFKFIREGIMLLFKVEAHSTLNTTGGFVASVARGFLLCSMAILLLRAGAMDYFTKNLENSFLAPKIVGLAPKAYESVYNGFVSKFFPTEELNKSVSSLADLSKVGEKKKEKKEKK